jgi:hypothetical protein
VAEKRAAKPLLYAVEGNCLGCPFVHDPEDEWPRKYCAHPRWETTDRWLGLRELPPHRRGYRLPPPDWCPLRRGPVLVALGTPPKKGLA